LAKYLGIGKQKTEAEGRVKVHIASNFNNFGGILSGPEDFEQPSLSKRSEFLAIWVGTYSQIR